MNRIVLVLLGVAALAAPAAAPRAQSSEPDK
jgi:hypothetical protein